MVMKKEDMVLVFTIESVVIGVVLGFMIRPFNPSNDAISLIGFPGEIFMQIVEMMILPLIISSVISALAQIRPNDAARIGGLTVLYYVMTTFLSTFTGIILVSSIHPGDPELRHSIREGSLDDTALSTLDTFLDQIRNMFPENIVQATFQQVQTNYIAVKPRVVVRTSSSSQHVPSVSAAANASVPLAAAGGTAVIVNETSLAANASSDVVMKPILEFTNEVNVLGLIVFCTGFGVILSMLGEQARLMINFFIVLDAVIMKWISALMWCYPIGILSLVCKNIVDIDNLTETAQALAMYVVTVICGLMIHSLLTLPMLYYAFTRDSPFRFMTGMLQAIATAFGTASSGASLPVTFRALEGNLRIDRRVTRFVLPLGATITMDGTALYEAVAVIFIAQLHNIQLSVLDLVTISLTTTVASIGSGSVPAGLDTILIVLATVGLPAKDLGLLLTVDWLLDRIRTSVNVLGDGFGCGIIYHLTKKRLIESDNDELIQQLRSEIKMLNAELPSVVTPGLATNADIPLLMGTQNNELRDQREQYHQQQQQQEQLLQQRRPKNRRRNNSTITQEQQYDNEQQHFTGYSMPPCEVIVENTEVTVADKDGLSNAALKEVRPADGRYYNIVDGSGEYLAGVQSLKPRINTVSEPAVHCCGEMRPIPVDKRSCYCASCLEGMTHNKRLPTVPYQQGRVPPPSPSSPMSGEAETAMPLTPRSNHGLTLRRRLSAPATRRPPEQQWHSQPQLNTRVREKTGTSTQIEPENCYYYSNGAHSRPQHYYPAHPLPNVPYYGSAYMPPMQYNQNPYGMPVVYYPLQHPQHYYQMRPPSPHHHNRGYSDAVRTGAVPCQVSDSHHESFMRQPPPPANRRRPSAASSNATTQSARMAIEERRSLLDGSVEFTI